MDTVFSEEQIMLRNAAVDFLKHELPKERVLEIDDSPDGYSEELWKHIVDLGWSGMCIPTEFGGSGNSFVDLGVVFEALGEYACPSPLLSTAVLSAQVILQLGSSAQKNALLPAIAESGLVVSFAYTEPDYGWGPEHVQMSAVRKDGGYVLNGDKLFVSDASYADQLLVIARTSTNGSSHRGLTAFLVDPKGPGVSIRRLVGWMSDSLCEVNLREVSVPASGVLGEVDEAWSGIELARDKATAALSAYMAGGARRVIDMAIEYSKSRVLYGVPISTCQRVQDHVIVGLNDADGAKWTAYEALWKLDEGEPDAAISVSAAKAAASVGYPRACECSHHVHAGIGTDLTYGLTQYTKRARTLEHYLGNATYHKKRMASLLLASSPAAVTA
jgi:alkylation response protein AidB-like acyl-CoA dehydrogenase